LVKDFNFFVEDGDLLKEDAIGSGKTYRPFSEANKRRKLTAIKETHS